MDLDAEMIQKYVKYQQAKEQRIDNDRTTATFYQLRDNSILAPSGSKARYPLTGVSKACHSEVGFLLSKKEWATLEHKNKFIYMLTKSNRSIKYLVIFLVAFPVGILLIRPIVATSERYLFLTLILTAFLLISWLPKKIFILSLGGAIIFYNLFLQRTLFYLGNAKVYAQDLILAALTVYIMVQVISKYRREVFKLKSTRFFLLFFLWGLLSIVRGYSDYGFSAIGESRWYVLIILYYFFILFSFHHKNDVPWFLKWMSFFITVMIIERFALFFFFNDNVTRTGNLAFRFINATEALLVAYLFIFLFLLISIHKKVLNLFHYAISFILLSIIIVVQHRSVWLSTAGGLFVIFIYFFYKKKRPKVLISIGCTILLIFIFAPFVSQ